MQKYEYCTVGTIDTYWSPSYPRLIFFTPSGRRVQDLGKESKSTSMSEEDYVASVIAKLGEAGWEMVSTGASGPSYGGSSYCIYFKRPKE